MKINRITHLRASFTAAVSFLAAAASGTNIFTNIYYFLPNQVNNFGLYTNFGGANSKAGLVLSGTTLYGTATSGGTNGTGTVYKVNQDGSAFTVLHEFRDGGTPSAAMVLSGHTLYGTTEKGGTNGSGAVFSIGTDGIGFANLHDFTPLLENDALGNFTNGDGAHPSGSLALMGTVLYGTAPDGGTNGNGAVFRLNTDGTGFTNLHNFSMLGTDTPTNADGAEPTAGLVIEAGKLYGTTEFGGTGGSGTVFSINPDGSGSTNLYSFSATINFTNGDGAYLFSGLVASNGTLFGTTLGGGIFGNGTLFSLSSDGTGFTNLYSFSATKSLTNWDGAKPAAALTLINSALYGTTQLGGSGGSGTIFSIATNGQGFQNLYDFSPERLNLDGAYTNIDGGFPQSPLTFSENSFYGTTMNGGTAGNGGVFVLSLGSIPLHIQIQGGVAILAWGNPAFLIQASTNLSGLFLTITNTASPFTNSASALQGFFRLDAF